MSALTFDDAIKLAHGCHDYNGGLFDELGEAYHDGISTVCAVLEKAQGAGSARADRQLAVVHAIGSEALRQRPVTDAEVLVALEVMFGRPTTGKSYSHLMAGIRLVLDADRKGLIAARAKP